MHGHGSLAYPDGRTYTGTFKDGKFHGLGTYHWPEEGKTYEGEFKQGKNKGFCKWTRDNGKASYGIWKGQGKGFER